MQIKVAPALSQLEHEEQSLLVLLAYLPACYQAIAPFLLVCFDVPVINTAQNVADEE